MKILEFFFLRMSFHYDLSDSNKYLGNLLSSKKSYSNVFFSESKARNGRRAYFLCFEIALETLYIPHQIHDIEEHA